MSNVSIDSTAEERPLHRFSDLSCAVNIHGNALGLTDFIHPTSNVCSLFSLNVNFVFLIFFYCSRSTLLDLVQASCTSFMYKLHLKVRVIPYYNL